MLTRNPVSCVAYRNSELSQNSEFTSVNQVHKTEGKKKKLSTPWRHTGEWRYSSVLNLGARCRWVVNVTPRPLYLPGKNHETHRIGGGGGGGRTGSERFGEEKKYFFSLTMFIPTSAQQFDTKIYNHIASLLHVSVFFRPSSGNCVFLFPFWNNSLKIAEKSPKHVRGLLYDCIFLNRTVVQLLE
jgi:hypothetical protein